MNTWSIFQNAYILLLLFHCYQDNCPHHSWESPSSWSSVLGTWGSSPIHQVLGGKGGLSRHGPAGGSVSQVVPPGGGCLCCQSRIGHDCPYNGIVGVADCPSYGDRVGVGGGNEKVTEYKYTHTQMYTHIHIHTHSHVHMVHLSKPMKGIPWIWYYNASGQPWLQWLWRVTGTCFTGQGLEFQQIIFNGNNTEFWMLSLLSYYYMDVRACVIQST